MAELRKFCIELESSEQNHIDTLLCKNKRKSNRWKFEAQA